MKYLKVNERMEVVAVSDELPEECKAAGGAAWSRQIGLLGDSYGAGWLAAWDIHDHPSPRLFSQQLAESASKLMGKVFLPVDQGPCVSPRYEVIEAPAVGDEVSKGFNGDYYPVGKIVKISDSYRVISVDGPRGKMKFYRKGESSGWSCKGWGLVRGVHDRMNPEF